jgi:S1-C subfamily serine protease
VTSGDVVDVAIGGAAVLAALGGYRIGFLGRVISWVGLAGGLYVAARLLPAVFRHLRSSSPSTLLVVAVGMLIGGAVIGQALGLFLGGRLHHVLPLGPLRTLDRLVGAAVGAAGMLTVVWLLLPTLAATQGTVSRAVDGSAVARAISRDLPAPPPALDVLRRIVGDGNPEVFAALAPAANVGAPPSSLPLSPSLVSAVSASTLKVQGQACQSIYDGSGFVVERGLVITNAHVVAGEKPGATSVLTPSGRVLAATVVSYDPYRDLALLSVPGLNEPPLPIGAPRQGELGAVFGHPNGQDPLAVVPARVAAIEEAVGPDIYGTHNTKRSILVMASDLARGDSGGAVVDPSGQVIGVAFAISAQQSGVSYALNTSELKAFLAEPRSAQASTGACLTGG